MSITIQNNISLRPFNTFGIDVLASSFATFNSIDQLTEAIAFNKDQPLLILGGGSNILLTKAFDGLVLKNDIKQLEVISQTDSHVFVKAGAGENWNDLVMFCVDNNYGGMENLSLIPGNVGASPMQNIGAYGIEVKDVFYQLEAYDLENKKVRIFNNEDCEFGYRESVFKNRYKGRFVILNVTFKLSKSPVFNTSYGAIEQELSKMNVCDLSIKNISNAIINIRKSKLPDPKIIGNAGSFFKNPQISSEEYFKIKSAHPEVPSFKLSDTDYKIPAAWLIERCGWKGYRKGDAGCHINQPLVLVNYGNASGNEILEIAQHIILAVYQKFQITLHKEVNII